LSAQTESACRVCGAASTFAFAQKVIGRDVSYFDCARCGYVQTESPYWLEEAYADPIDELDTGIMWRNSQNALCVVSTLAAARRIRGRVLDHAGGYGILVRLLRDAGVEAHWEDKYCKNLLSRGFEADDKAYDLVTAFEVFEHLAHPLQELEAMLARAGLALISTNLITTKETPAPDWWYYGPEHGQHIGFFRLRTLMHMAQRLGCYCRSNGRTLHLFSRQPIPVWWLVLHRLPLAARLAARLRLRSKVWADFETIRNRRRAVTDFAELKTPRKGAL
jgi:hypothetical protein